MSKLEAATVDKFNLRCQNSEIKKTYLDKLKAGIDQRKETKRQ